MCLSIPARIVEIKDKVATADVGGNKCEIGIDFVPHVKIDDYVLVHSGYAIEIIDDEQAEQTLSLLREILEFEDKLT